MYWIIQNNIYSEDGWQRLVDALGRLGISYSVHKCVPFAGTLEPAPTPPHGPVVVMGSYTLAREAQRRGWVPGAFLNKTFNHVTQVEKWGTNMFNHGACVRHLRDVPEQREPFFIRPVDDSKAFTGEVMDWPSFTAWRDRVTKMEDHDQVGPTTWVVVARKRSIAREFRTWVVDGRVVTASLYRSGSWKHCQEETRDTQPLVYLFAETLAAAWSPARAFVMDVFEDADDGKLYVGEVNNLNSAGFYAADMQKLVHAIDSMDY